MSVVYFVESVDRVAIKIGVTDNIGLRLKTLQIGSYAPLRLLAQIPGARELEQALHRRFAATRLCGEWFTASDALRDFIRSVEGPAYPYDTLKSDSPFLGLIGRGYPRSFYKAYAQDPAGQWWKFEMGAARCPSGLDPIARQARRKKRDRARSVSGRLADAIGYAGQPDNPSLLRLLTRAAELEAGST